MGQDRWADRQTWLRQNFGCAEIQDLFGLLAFYISRDTCYRLHTMRSRHSTWPVAQHHGSIKANLHHIQMSTHSQNRNMSSALLETLLPLNVDAHLREW